MTSPHAQVSGLPPPVLEPSARRVFRLVCGGCGGEVVLDSDSAEDHVRCPHCSHRVQVIRSASHTCAHCGATVSADLTRGTSVGICDRCNQPYMVGSVTAPVLKRYRHHHHHRRPWTGGEAITRESGIGVIVMSAVVLLSMLVVLLLSLS